MKKLSMALLLFCCLFFSSCKIFKASSAFYAKESCSCLFVEKLSDSYCHHYANQILPIWSKEINKEQKLVSAHGYGHSTKAAYIGEPFGCQIIE